jgi:pyrimidine-nucleoside phosphorylase
MLFAEVIRHKRDGHKLDTAVIAEIINDYSHDRIPDYQMAALLMAVYFKGLDATELWAWASAMLHSGDVMDFSDISGPKIDKHSTGGVGDKISIPLAPAVAVCGVNVPMISGRGLGHTGGTLDKLESIPGFRTGLTLDEFRAGLKRNGAAMLGQTENICPADKRMYALRDVTGTVESIPLIAASIMSKKLAEGISGLVLDVKVGSGAFMKTPERARELAKTLVAVGKAGGVKTTAFITDMNQPLGWAVGNALEIRESIQILRGAGPADTTELTVAFGAEMLRLGDVVANVEEGRARIQGAIASGAALDRFRQMVAAQGGNPAVVDNPDLLPTARHSVGVKAAGAGYVISIDSEKVGIASLILGGGRRRKEDDIDPAVGVRVLARRGTMVGPDDDVAVIEYNDDSSLGEAVAMIAQAFCVGEERSAEMPLVMEMIS